MRRLLSRALPLLIPVLALSGVVGCGKRADPLPPYLKTPRPPTGLDVSQVGESVEVRIIAPSTTTQTRPLPVIELEWLQAAPTEAFGKTAKSMLREEVAPGELRIKTFPIPLTEVRFSVVAINGRARSLPAAPVAFKPAPVPSPPSALEGVNTPAGVELRWINPPGAEPWPTPTPTPSPSPAPSVSPSPQPSPGETPLAGPVAAPPPGPSPASAPLPAAPPDTPPDNLQPPPSTSPSPMPLPGTPPEEAQAPALPEEPAPGVPGGSPTPTPTPTPSPTPTPTPPITTGIRIFRTDGAPRLALPPLRASTWLDTSPKAGQTPCYALRYASSLKPLVESASTEPVCVEVKDLIFPDPPDQLVGDIGETFVELTWTPSPSADVDSYRVYRTAEWEARAMIIQTEGLLLRVRDLRMTPGPRTYEVTAVDKGGNESRPSAPFTITIP